MIILFPRWVRNEDTEATNPKWQYELNWTKTFKNNEDHTFQVSALGSSFAKDLSSVFIDRTLEGENVDSNQLTATTFDQTDYTFKADYVNPITEKYTFETGALYVINE